MAHEVESMFYVREVPWHGLGTRVEEAPDSEVALIRAGLLWAVESKPIFLPDGRQVHGYKANIRSTDGAVLGVVSDSYQIIQNREAFAFTDALLGEGVRYETAGSLRGGKRVWLLARLPERYKILGDEFEPYLCFTNGHDGFWALRVIVTPIRVVCMNTLNLALVGARRSWSTIHVGDISARLQEARRTLGLAQAYYEALGGEAERLAGIKVPIEKYIGELFPMPEDAGKTAQNNVKKRREELADRAYTKDLEPFWDSAWAFINGVADMVSHRQPLRQTDTWAERRFESILDGPALLDQAYALVRR
ncbi:MAG: DUF932 domain-containing protein [Firmicutes bacterium]|nr:DUF932 domain-containing protein [Bacillota bacterium]